MKFGNNYLQSFPTALIVNIMHRVVSSGCFEDLFICFIAWSQAHRPIVIASLLEEFPLRGIYKFGKIGSVADKACFDHIFHIGDQLIVADEIIYIRCRNLLSGVGNIDDHFLYSFPYFHFFLKFPDL